MSWLSVGNSGASTALAQSWTSEFAVEARNLVKDFGEKRAVDGCKPHRPDRLDLRPAWPNGAGKTTTLRMLLGIIDPSSGERSVLGNIRPLEVASRSWLSSEERWSSIHR
jgi:ABC-2 type transport system ATP-binding protein